MAALHSDLTVPTYFLKEDARKTGSEFDVNRYFSALKHLSLPSGDMLDYFYFYGGIGGEPALYVRPSEQPPYQTRADYEAANGKISLDEIQQYKFMDSVQIDDTTEGFFQFIVLRIMGNQFYQYWHAGYNDYRIICSHAGLNTLLSSLNDYRQSLPLLVQVQAQLLDFTPNVEIDTDTVRAQVIVFTKWGGFQRQTYIFNRQYPHTLIKKDVETVVAYDYGVAYQHGFTAGLPSGVRAEDVRLGRWRGGDAEGVSPPLATAATNPVEVNTCIRYDLPKKAILNRFAVLMQ